MTGVRAFRANAGLFLSCKPVIPGVNKLYQAEQRFISSWAELAAFSIDAAHHARDFQGARYH
jgi:hypothetical protein